MDHQVLKPGNILLLSAYSRVRAALAAYRLFALVAKHAHSVPSLSVEWIMVKLVAAIFRYVNLGRPSLPLCTDLQTCTR
jgi:hypothetical protein